METSFNAIVCIGFLTLGMICAGYQLDAHAARLAAVEARVARCAVR